MVGPADGTRNLVLIFVTAYIAIVIGLEVNEAVQHSITRDECFDTGGNLVNESITTPSGENSIWYCEHPNGTKTWVPGDYERDDQHEPPQEPNGVILP